MNDIVKWALTFAGGVGVGSGVTALVMKHKMDTKVMSLVDEVTEKIRRDYNDRTDTLREENERLHAKVEQAAKEEYDRLTKPNRYDIPGEDPVDLPEFEAPEEDAHAEEEIYAIGVEDFMNDGAYEKVYLTYYRGDHVLCDEAEEEMTNAVSNLGETGAFLDHVSDDVIYIRNLRTGTDYQVDFAAGSYAEEVAGFEE